MPNTPDCLLIGGHMSKTHKSKKHKGFLDHVAHVRKERKQIRGLKLDPMMHVFDISPRNRFVTVQDF